MNWKNFPIPETIIIPLLTGLAIDYFFPQKLFQLTNPTLLIAAFLFVAGLLLMFWAFFNAGKLDVSSPDTLLTSGPFALSRNPMYVSWLIIHFAAFLFFRSIWLLLGFVVAALLTHRLAIIPEERFLREKFGDSFVRYCERVRRYI
jgi:protein-S-isoprenylcysteine O-methyltransferase Ste14